MAIKRYLLAVFVLVASFALDGLAMRARTVVLIAVPKWFLLSVAEVGSPVALGAVVAILAACGLLARRSRLTRATVVLASALAATGLGVLSLKWLASRGPDGVFYGFGRAEEGIMFPSGHTAMAFAAWVVIGAVWRKARWPAWAIAAGVAISRATLIHLLSDVVAGALIGLLVGRLVTGWAAKKGFLELDPGPHAASAKDHAWAPGKR
jgi:membrane-associated phospholipid phosphatase